MIRFKEPGTGHLMQLGKWYIVSDSGYLYSSDAFDSPDDAVRRWRTSLYMTYELPEHMNHIYVPPYDRTTSSWGEGAGEAVQVLKADDLLHFWQTEDPEMLEPF